MIASPIVKRLFALSLGAFLSLFFWANPILAQTLEIPARIVGPVNEQSRIALRGNVSPAVQPRFDRGAVPGWTEMSHMRIVLRRSRAQQAALDRFEQELQEKNSPNYHNWLTPEEFGRRYGAADADIAAIVAWLQAHGFTVYPVAPGKTGIEFSGTANQVQEAFHTAIHAYEVHGLRFRSNNSNPEIPAALAPLIEGIANLNTIRPRPSAVHGRPGILNPVSRRFEAAPAGGASRPAYKTGSSNFLYLVPGDAATIYDTPNPVLNANYGSGTQYDGTGVTIGIIGTSIINPATVQNYRSRFLGDNTGPVITNLDGVTFTDGSDEPYLDVELAGGLAPGATIHYYVANDLTTPLERALTDNTVDILTYSYEECEKFNTSAGNAATEKMWEQAAAQGIAVTVAAGDTGSADCDSATDSSGSDTPQATDGLAVNGYASTPYDLAVGGTDFDALTQAGSTYTASTASAKTYYRTALQYIPEATWNDSAQYNNGVPYNMPWGTGISVHPANISGGGGGASNCAKNDTATNPGACISGYPKPSWQRGTGVPADGARDVPDVALMAGNGFYDAAWLSCDDANDCSTKPDGSFSFDSFGGTSASAPAFAGILALVEQSTGGRLGQAAAQLYDLFNSSHAAQIFHDVSQGSNSVSCAQGSANCSKDKDGYYFESGYNAAAGYDLASGLGSVDVAQLISYWSTTVSPATPTVTATATPASIAVNQSDSVTVTVAGSTGLATPTGTVTLTGGGFTSAAQNLVDGSCTLVIPANSMSAGTDTLIISYSGDSNYASASGTVTVTVTPVTTAPGSFTLSATTPAAIAQGASATSTITLTGSNGYTGAVTLSCALNSSPAGAVDLPACSIGGGAVSLNSTVPSATATATVTTSAPTSADLRALPGAPLKWWTAAGGSLLAAVVVFLFPPGRLRRARRMLGACMLLIAVGFAGAGCGTTNRSANSGAGSGGGGGGGSGGGGTPTKTTPAVTVKTSTGSMASNTPLSVAVTVTGSGSSTPTGSITLASGSYTSSAAALAKGAATVTIPPGSLSAGKDTLTATYSGDSNYNAATGSSAIMVTAPPPTGGTTPGTYIFTVTGIGSDAAKTTATTTFTVTVS
jgi:hypothetical protein